MGTGDAGRSLAYTYDSLGRLLTATTIGSTQYPAWSLTETYDRYANRTSQQFTVGTGYNVSFSYSQTKNQIIGFTYDAAGNIIAEPSPAVSFSFDHEECNTGYSGGGTSATYVCDGNGLRVQKIVTGTGAVNTVYVRSAGQVLAEYDNAAAVASPTRENLYGSNLLAVVTGSTAGSGGTIIYQHRDHLSPRVYTDANGNCVGSQATTPFGELWYSNDGSCGSTTSSSWIFTTYERDSESGNDYALARSYASTQGRFFSPDPVEGIVGDPQSWNRYAYVENDPINLSDPSGQDFLGDLIDGILNIMFWYLGHGGSFNANAQIPTQPGCPTGIPCMTLLPPTVGTLPGMSDAETANPWAIPDCPPTGTCNDTENSPINMSVKKTMKVGIHRDYDPGDGNPVVFVGGRLEITLTDAQGKPVSGTAQEHNKIESNLGLTKNENPKPVDLTKSGGVIKDSVGVSAPRGTTDKHVQDDIDMGIVWNNTQTLVIITPSGTYNAVWTRTLTNMNSRGKVAGDLDLTWTAPTITRVSP